MPKPEKDPSVDAEPHLQDRRHAPDSSEDKAVKKLAGERARADPARERAEHSVFDEPATLPNRDPAVIEQDWYCRNCGYNLRGLLTQYPCPECGVVERYEPPRETEATYTKWATRHKTDRAARKAWAVAMLTPLSGVPFAFVAAIFTIEYAMLLNFVAIGPAMSELLKVAVCLTLIERRSALIQRPGQIHLMTIGAAVVFSLVQNAIYLSTYITNPPIQLIAWRWIGCLLLHVLCTSIAAYGLVRVWERTQREGRPAKLSLAYPMLAVAIVVHGVYNAYVFETGHFGYGF